MQYLLTQEEYDALYEDSNSQTEQLEIENLQLRRQIQSFIEMAEFTAFRSAEHLGELTVDFRIKSNKIPPLFSELMREKGFRIR